MFLIDNKFEILVKSMPRKRNLEVSVCVNQRNRA
ncbi:MAG: hypothetical protein ACI9WL_000351, partial [Rubritalea sp.]